MTTLNNLLQTAKKDFREKYDDFFESGTNIYTRDSVEQFLEDKMRESYYLGCKKEALDRIKALKEKK